MADDSSEVVKEQSEVVAATDLKAVGEGPAFYSNMMMANSVTAQMQWNGVAQAIATKCADAILNTNAQESSGNIATLMELMKAMSSPNIMYPPIQGGNTQGQAAG